MSNIFSDQEHLKSNEKFNLQIFKGIDGYYIKSQSCQNYKSLLSLPFQMILDPRREEVQTVSVMLFRIHLWLRL